MKERLTLTLSTSVQKLTSGVDAVQGIGEDTLFTFGTVYNTLSFNTDDIISIFLNDSSTGYQTLIGGGQVTGITPNFTFTFDQKTYVLGNYTVYMSAIDQPTIWNDPNASGNGNVALADFYGTQQTLLAAAPFQGRIAFFARSCVQIYNINADIAQWNRSQVMQNTGTVAAQSVQSIGDLDVMYLADTGFRSLRARETTLNAFVDDVGSPIDTLVNHPTAPTSACAIVEPKTMRYWCFLDGYIYVLSRFLANQITAWSRYIPTYDTEKTASAATYPEIASAFVGFTGLTVGRTYFFVKGANETGMLYATGQLLTSSGTFVATQTTAIMFGTAGASVTGKLYEATPFTPTQFLINNGQVWARDASRFYQYGGSDGVTYDYSQGNGATTWLDLDAPTALKKGRGLDTAFSGNFSFLLGTNNLVGTMKEVFNGNQVTFQKGKYAISLDGYHVKFQFKTLDNNAAKVSSVIFNYDLGTQK
jgi:hypothetical protein